MKLKVFTQAAGLMSGKIPTKSLETEANQWFEANPNITIVEVKHDVAAGFWSYTQLIVSVYYTENAK